MLYNTLDPPTNLQLLRWLPWNDVARRALVSWDVSVTPRLQYEVAMLDDAEAATGHEWRRETPHHRALTFPLVAGQVCAIQVRAFNSAGGSLWTERLLVSWHEATT